VEVVHAHGLVRIVAAVSVAHEQHCGTEPRVSEILRVVLGLSREKRWYLEMENTSLSEVLIAEDFISLKRLNDTCHLAALV